MITRKSLDQQRLKSICLADESTPEQAIKAANELLARWGARERIVPVVRAVIRRCEESDTQPTDDPVVAAQERRVHEAIELLRNNLAFATKNRITKSETVDAPPANLLKENVITKFANGQSWTLQNGQPVEVK